MSMHHTETYAILAIPRHAWRAIEKAFDEVGDLETRKGDDHGDPIIMIGGGIAFGISAVVEPVVTLTPDDEPLVKLLEEILNEDNTTIYSSSIETHGDGRWSCEEWEARAKAAVAHHKATVLKYSQPMVAKTPDMVLQGKLSATCNGVELSAEQIKQSTEDLALRATAEQPSVVDMIKGMK